MTYRWKDDAFSDPDDHHSFLYISFDEAACAFVFDTGYLEITIKLMQKFKVRLEDTGGPGQANFLNIIGWAKFNYLEWEKEYNELG